MPKKNKTSGYRQRLLADRRRQRDNRVQSRRCVNTDQDSEAQDTEQTGAIESVSVPLVQTPTCSASQPDNRSCITSTKAEQSHNECPPMLQSRTTKHSTCTISQHELGSKSMYPIAVKIAEKNREVMHCFPVPQGYRIPKLSQPNLLLEGQSNGTVCRECEPCNSKCLEKQSRLHCNNINKEMVSASYARNRKGSNIEQNSTKQFNDNQKTKKKVKPTVYNRNTCVENSAENCANKDEIQSSKFRHNEQCSHSKCIMKRKRENPEYREREKCRETQTRKRKREDTDYRQSEQLGDTLRRKRKREDTDYRESEKCRETQTRQHKRKDTDYRKSEKCRETQTRHRKREDTDYRQSEQLGDTLRRQHNRKYTDYRESEKCRETQTRQHKRKDTDYRKSEKCRETQTRHRKREDTDYRQSEQLGDTLRRQHKRKYTDYRESEKCRETQTRQHKREDTDYRQSEQLGDTLRRQHKRKYTDYRESEKCRETQTRQHKRKDTDYRKSEKCRETQTRHRKREDTDYRQSEQLGDTLRRRQQREDPHVRLCEGNRDRFDHQHKRQQKKTIEELIVQFHNTVSEGPVYVCTSCNQLFYKHSVMTFPTSLTNSSDGNTQAILHNCPKTIGRDGKIWMCRTCFTYLRKGKVPPMSIMNKMMFPTRCILQELNPLEQTLLAVRLPFMKIHQAPRGKQKKLHGNMVLVPADVDNTVTQLPRVHSNTGTIKATLKRRLRYKHHVYCLNIRPQLVKSAAKYLANAPLYKQHITYNTGWNETCIEDSSLSESEEGTEMPSGNDTVDQAKDDEDQWSEIDEGELMSGEGDTLLTSQDYIEPGERDNLYHFAPAEGSIPVSVFMETDSEELAFPGIFCGETRPSNADRPVNVTYGGIVKSELRNSDRRVSNNIENIFFKTKKLQMKTLLDQSQLALRKVKLPTGNLTVRDVRGDAANSLIHQDKAYKFLASIRGSPPYFEKVSKDLFAMIRQLGPATFFITLSAAETRWKHLLRILGYVVDKKEYTDQELEDMIWDDKCRLIQSDPITCARHFDYSVSKFISSFMQSTCQPIGNIDDYFYRVEYQQRGSPHIHMMVWCKDSPKFGVDSDDQVCEFIDRFITCTSSITDSELSELVALQSHRHSHTCRMKREKKCRFSYPKPPMKETVILYPLDSDTTRKTKEEYRQKYKCIQDFLNDHEDDTQVTFEHLLESMNMDENVYRNAIRSTLKSPTVMLKRDVCDCRVNNYNKDILRAWRANIDIQYVLDVYACATYVASYVTKSQRGMSELLRHAAQEVKSGNMNLKEQIRAVGNKFLNAVEISAQEAAYICLQIPMKRSSRHVVFINTSPPSERVALLKPQSILEKMNEEDDDIEYSNDIL